MPRTGLEMLTRLAERAVGIHGRSTDTAIRVAGDPVVEATATFNAEDSNVRKVATAERRERKERDIGVEPLGRVYDTVRSATLARLPHAEVPGRSSTLGTPDDVVNAALDLEDLLCDVAGVDADHPLAGTGAAAPTGEKWAKDLLGELERPLSAAVKEANEATAASADLQKARERRMSAAAVLRTRVVAFRRVVRDVYGAQSREHHSLRIRGRSDDDEAEGGAPAPGGPAPGGGAPA